MLPDVYLIVTFYSWQEFGTVCFETNLFNFGLLVLLGKVWWLSSSTTSLCLNCCKTPFAVFCNFIWRECIIYRPSLCSFLFSLWWGEHTYKCLCTEIVWWHSVRRQLFWWSQISINFKRLLNFVKIQDNLYLYCGELKDFLGTWFERHWVFAW